MLYWYASLEYLQKFHLALSQIVEGAVDPALAAPAGHPYSHYNILSNAQWGKHDACKVSHPCPFNIFDGLRNEVAKDIGARKSGIYKRTATDDQMRWIDEHWWPTLAPEEEHQYKLQVELINHFAHPIDDIFSAYSSRWDDRSFIRRFASFRIESPRIPKFRLRPDIVGESGQEVPLTGVYIPVDDPHASPQFAVKSNASLRLKDARTFNQVGLDALATIGRTELWLNDEKMFDFAIERKLLEKHRSRPNSDRGYLHSLATIAVSENAFDSRASTWHFVEAIPNEFDDVDFAPLAIPAPRLPHPRKAGQHCSTSGYYFSVSHVGSNRFFKAGDIFPALEGTVDQTTWQWDVGLYSACQA